MKKLILIALGLLSGYGGMAQTTNDAGVSAISSPTSPVLSGTNQPISVTVKNYGTSPLTAVTLGFSVNGVVQPTFAWTGNIFANATSTAVTIGNFTFPAGNHTVKAWSKLPNGATDGNATNDTTTIQLSTCTVMSGNYTINKNAAASATNFVSFTAAAERLHNCGVSGKVVVSVVSGSGPYTEQVDILTIPGVNAANRVVLEGNGNTLIAAPTSQKSSILKLDNADFVKINNLKIDMLGTGSVANFTYPGIQLVNNSDNDTISNCTITLPFTNGSTGMHIGILAGATIIAAGNNTNNSVIMNNTVSGGVYGIKINGNTGGTNAVNNKVLGNTVLDGNAYGIVLDNVDGNLVEGNVVQRPTLTGATTFRAINLDGTYKNNTISKNRVSNLFGGGASVSGSAYGLHFSGAGAPAGSENKVVNNLITDTNTPSFFYGIYNEGSSGMYFFHNTITSIPTAGFYGYYQAVLPVSNVKFYNNTIAVLPGTGAGNIYGLYLKVAIETNYNDIYLAPGHPNSNFGYYVSTNYASFSTWKAANNNAFDQQSVDFNPIFQNVSGHFIPSNPLVNNVGKPLPAVTFDMLNNARNATTPDPGAYEFSPSIADAAVTAISSPQSNCGLTSQETVIITIKNLAGVTPASVPVSFRVDGGTPVVETFTGSLPFNTIATYTFTAKANLSAPGSHRILVKTLLPGDTDPANDTMSVSVVNLPQLTLPVVLNFETPASGLGVMKRVTNAKSGITEGAGASNGAGSAKGLILDGVDNAAWSTPSGTTNPWTINADNFAGVYFCISPAGGLATDSLWMTFDLKQLFKTANTNTNFRVMVNGTQVGPTYRPPFAGTPIIWQKLKVDLTAFKNASNLMIGLESSVKEAYANGTGTANLIDNITFKRFIVQPTGVKNEMQASQIHVFPNPSNGQFNIDLPKSKTYELEVTDLTGKVLMKQTAKGSTQLYLEGRAKGIYLLNVSGENGATVRKLIIE